MQTPEGRLKDKIKAFLKLKGVASLTRPVENARGFYWMPVVGNFGSPFLDFVGCYNGRFFAIETKAPGQKPTPRQQINIALVEQARGEVWVGDDFDEFKDWWGRIIY